jgi:hypothetical protein
MQKTTVTEMEMNEANEGELLAVRCQIVSGFALLLQSAFQACLPKLMS